MARGNRIDFRARIDIDYPYIIEQGASTQLHRFLGQWVRPESSVGVISDSTVAKHYWPTIAAGLREAGIHDLSLFTFAPGEHSKSPETHVRLVTDMMDAGVHRQSILMALGGGVVCDTVGYLAATYMRGINYINIPTSLIAQVDASVGGKVGVNHPRCKNLIGSFWHPIAVVIDPSFLQSLPVDEVRNGLAEIVKIAMIHSPGLFEFLEEHAQELIGGTLLADEDELDELIAQAVRAKIELLLPDPFERDLRRLLNFGHTFAHPLEVAKGFELRHGFAVSVGMCIATRVALARRLIAPSVAARVFNLLTRLGLPTAGPPMDPVEVWNHAGIVRRIRANHFNFVVPTGIGTAVIIDDLRKQEFEEAYTDAVQPEARGFWAQAFGASTQSQREENSCS